MYKLFNIGVIQKVRSLETSSFSTSGSQNKKHLATSITSRMTNVKQDLLAATNKVDQEFICNIINNAGGTVYISIYIFDK